MVSCKAESKIERNKDIARQTVAKLIILYCIVLYCIVLYSIELHCSVMNDTMKYSN